MPQQVTLRGPEYNFEAFTVNEAKKLGLLDYEGKTGTHSPISCQFKQGEGMKLRMMLSGWKEEGRPIVLIATARGTVTAYQPKRGLIGRRNFTSQAK